MICNGGWIFNFYALFKRAFKNQQINPLVDKNLNCNPLTIPKNTQEKMFRAYMTVPQSYSLFLAVPKDILNPL
jgi:hypothetical protein